MSVLQRAIEPRLGPVAARAGFVLADRVDPGNDDGGFGHLEYRLEDGARLVLLDLCQVADRRTVSAVLWTPSDLATTGADGGVDEVAIRHRRWHYAAPTDEEALAQEVVEEIAAWLGRAPWTTA